MPTRAIRSYCAALAVTAGALPALGQSFTVVSEQETYLPLSANGALGVCAVAPFSEFWSAPGTLGPPTAIPFVMGVSPSGQWALGADGSGARESRAGVIASIPTVGAVPVAEIVGSSLDDSTLVGTEGTPGLERAFRWTSAGSTALLPLPDDDVASRGHGVSHDGNTAVGMIEGPTFGRRAYRWTPAGGTQPLAGNAAPFVQGAATGVSADGTTIIGGRDPMSYLPAWRWTSSGLNRLGSGLRAWRWTSSALDTVLAAPAGAQWGTVALGVSGDGSLVVGAAGSLGGGEAVVWDAANVPHKLKDLLTGAGGTSHGGYLLLDIRAVSSDGHTVSGVAKRLSDGALVSYVATIPAVGGSETTPPCGPADIAKQGGQVGADGQVTVDDLVVFLSRFFAGDLNVADLVSQGGAETPDGQVTVDDLVYFLSRFFGPCPAP
ncbi:MAG: GC-type dockerin domain-anchored protein [Phycisphaerales bacterium]